MSGSITQGGTLDGDLELDCDVVVVGSGAGGMVVAAELAEAGHDVVILEEGRHYTPEEYGAMRPSESMRHLWRDGALTFAVGMDDSPMINVTMGRAVGGSSVLTGGVCFRTPGYILDDWAKRLGLSDLTEASMDPCFTAVEKSVHVEEVPVSMRSKSTLMFARGAEQQGFKLKPLRRNTKNCNGCGRCNFGCPHGAKLSVDAAYLPRALAAGARLYSECFVDRVTSDGGRATGVVGRLTRGSSRRKTGRLTVRARRVVVAAGSYFSPGILARSGVGKQSGQLGRNMTLHPGFRMMARFDERLDGWKGALQSAYSDEYEKDHITMVGLFIPPGVIAATMKGVGPKHLAKARGVPHVAVFGGMIHDEGGGTVRNVLGRTFATYKMHPRDRATMPKVVRIMAETFFAGGAKEVYLPILGLDAVTPDSLRTLDLDHIPAKRYECSSQHPLGTCRMGSTAAHSVVDPSGESWELSGLFVADGSIVPTSLGVNPQVTIMSMATRIAWKMRDRPYD